MLIIFCFLYAILYFLSDYQDRSSFVLLNIVISLCILGFTLRKTNTSIISLYGFFSLGFFVVFFQWPVMYAVFDIKPSSIYWLFRKEEYIGFITWLSSMSYFLFSIGYSFPIRKKTGITLTPCFYAENRSGIYLLFACFMLFLVTAPSTFYSGSVYKGGGGSSSGGGISSYFQILVACLHFFVTTNLFFRYHNTKKIDYVTAILLALISFLFLYSGDRGLFLSWFVLNIVLFNTYVKKINIGYFCLLVFGLLTLFGFVSFIRGSQAQDSVFALSEYGIFSFTIELASSIRAIYWGYDLILEGGDYHFGRLFLGNLFSLLPGAQSFIVSLFDLDPVNTGSAAYLTRAEQGFFSNYGEGSNLLADIYLNFGSIGCLCFMSFFGYLFGIAENSIYKPSIVKNILYTVLVAYSVYISRGEFFIFLRPFFWLVIFYYLSTFIQRRFRV